MYAGKCRKPLRGSLSGRPRSTATRSSSPRPGRKRDQRRVLLRAAPSSLTARHQQEQQRSAVGAPSEGRAPPCRARARGAGGRSTIKPTANHANAWATERHTRSLPRGVTFNLKAQVRNTWGAKKSLILTIRIRLACMTQPVPSQRPLPPLLPRRFRQANGDIAAVCNSSISSRCSRPYPSCRENRSSEFSERQTANRNQILTSNAAL